MGLPDRARPVHRSRYKGAVHLAKSPDLCPPPGSRLRTRMRWSALALACGIGLGPSSGAIAVRNGKPGRKVLPSKRSCILLLPELYSAHLWIGSAVGASAPGAKKKSRTPAYKLQGNSWGKMFPWSP